MSKHTPRYIRLGLFVIVALVLFTVVVYNIGSKQHYFSETIHLQTHFKDVNGLQAGNNVRFGGISVGTVEEIQVVDDSTLLVIMRMNADVKRYLKKNAVTSIGSDGLVGNMVVNIKPTEKEAELVEDGDLLPSFERVDASEMLNTLGNTNENIALLALNLLEITEKINEGEGSLASMINDPEIARSLKQSARNLEAVSRQMRQLTQSLQQSVDQVTEGDGLLGFLLTDTTFRDQMAQFNEQLDTAWSHRMEPMMQNLEMSSQNLVESTDQIQSIVGQIDSAQGAVDAVLTDTVMANDLRQTMENIQIGTKMFNQNMEAMRHNFLFRRYFRKLERKQKKEVEKEKASK